MLTGDLATFPLSDLLQWADSSRAKGILTIERAPGVAVTLRIADRQIVGSDRAAAVHGPAPNEAMEVARAQERVLDQFVLEGGRFHFYEDDGGGEVEVKLDLSLQAVVMEGMQHRDDWPRLDALYAVETNRVGTTAQEARGTLPALSEAILTAAARRPSLAELRTLLGVSRPALVRRLHELCLIGRLAVDGTSLGADPLGKLIAQTMILLREQQFHEADIVLTALFEQDPTDPRVRWLRAVAEQRQVNALYEGLDPMAVVERLAPGASSPALSSAEREVLGRVNGHWDVATLVLASPLREVETLKILRKLARASLIAFRR